MYGHGNLLMYRLEANAPLGWHLVDRYPTQGEADRMRTTFAQAWPGIAFRVVADGGATGPESGPDKGGERT